MGSRKLTAIAILWGSLVQVQAHEQPDKGLAMPTPFVWQGVYIGAQLGHGFAGRGLDEIIRIGGPKGSLVGVRLGWNAEIGRLILGLSADISHSMIGQSILNAKGTVPWLGSVTARLGYAVTPSTLVYGLVGPAVGRGQIRFPGFSLAHQHIGLTVGGGLEQRFGSKISLYAEYRYIGLAPKSYSPLPLRLGYEGHVALIGFNLRLN